MVIPSLDERAVPVVPDCEALIDGWKADSDRLFPKRNEPKYAQADPVRPFGPMLWKDGRVYWFEVNQRTCHVLQQAWLPDFGCGDLVATGQLSSETDKHERVGANARRSTKLLGASAWFIPEGQSCANDNPPVNLVFPGGE